MIRNNALENSARGGFLTADTLQVEHWRVLTDSNGDFSFRGIPTGLRVAVGVETNESRVSKTVADVVLGPGEVQVIAPFRLNQEVNADATPLADRFASLLKTNRLMHTRALVVVSGGGVNAKRFVDDHVLDVSEHPDVYWYIPMSLNAASLDDKKTDKVVYEEKGWMLGAAEMVLVVAHDDNGLEIGRQRIDTSTTQHESASVKSFEQFLETHKPQQEDAEERLGQALAEAKATDRRIWVVYSGTRCGTCRVMARWIDSQKELLDKMVIHVHLDDARDLNSAKVRRRLNDPEGGIPWHAILDAEGNVLINCETELLGKIGAPDDSPETLTRFRQMIEIASNGHLSEKEKESLIESVKKN